MRVIYSPAVRHDVQGAIGWLLGDETVQFPIDHPVEVAEHTWQKLEKEPGIARLLASGELRLIG